MLYIITSEFWCEAFWSKVFEFTLKLDLPAIALIIKARRQFTCVLLASAWKMDLWGLLAKSSIKKFWYMGVIQFFFYKEKWRTSVLSVGPIIPLFCTSPRDVHPEFQSQGDTVCVLSHLHVMDSPNSPLVWHLLALVATGYIFIYIISRGTIRLFNWMVLITCLENIKWYGWGTRQYKWYRRVASLHYLNLHSNTVMSLWDVKSLWHVSLRYNITNIWFFPNNMSFSHTLRTIILSHYLWAKALRKYDKNYCPSCVAISSYCWEKIKYLIHIVIAFKYTPTPYCHICTGSVCQSIIS